MPSHKAHAFHAPEEALRGDNDVNEALLHRPDQLPGRLPVPHKNHKLLKFRTQLQISPHFPKFGIPPHKALHLSFLLLYWPSYGQYLQIQEFPFSSFP